MAWEAPAVYLHVENIGYDEDGRAVNGERLIDIRPGEPDADLFDPAGDSEAKTAKDN